MPVLTAYVYKDAHYGAAATIASDTASTLSMGRSDSYGDTDVCMQVDLASIPPLATVTQAVCAFYVDSVTNWSTQPIEARRATSAWSEVNGTTAPSISGSDDVVTPNIAAAGQVTDTDTSGGWLTLAQGWIDYTITNYGWVFRGETLAGDTDSLAIRARESASDPYIEVTYTEDIQVFYPVSTVGATGWTDASAGTTNIWQSIDDTYSSPSDADYIQVTPGGR